MATTPKQLAGETPQQYGEFLTWLAAGPNRPPPANPELAARCRWAERARLADAQEADGDGPPAELARELKLNLLRLAHREARKTLHASQMTDSITIPLRDIVEACKLIMTTADLEAVLQVKGRGTDLSSLDESDLRALAAAARKLGPGSLPS